MNQGSQSLQEGWPGKSGLIKQIFFSERKRLTSWHMVRNMWEIHSCQKNDECYPRVLRDIKTAPEILYYVGDISICENIVIAVVGKRDATERYLRIAKQIGAVLAKEGFTVLNGLAVGVDAYASEGAVEERGKDVAVMPGGLRCKVFKTTGVFCGGFGRGNSCWESNIDC